ncbi:hypothetical protein AB0J86_12260 [Micromonospora sp. NPDC049559]|uniref:hypothetical protein n=1 Tax=Micromonospora sp. NPDC049559 TaxID=3155923 RepID=UPI003448B281
MRSIVTALTRRPRRADGAPDATEPATATESATEPTTTSPADATESEFEPKPEADLPGEPEAEPAPGTERAETGTGTGKAGRRAGVRLDRRTLVLAVATLLAAGVAGAAWYGQDRAERRDTAVRQALAAATPAAKAVFSYDYRSFDTSVANGRTFVTGAFADEYAQTTATLRATALSEQAVVLAEVSAAGVIEASPDRVELLVYLNQYRRNVNTAGEKVDQNRVVLELVPEHGEWKVAKATAI